jgi:deazaflavin-dependent oxidoreductase (nitroreductase family)
MPMPLWWGQVNKRVFNPSALKNGKWDIITHIGRVSGTTYRTPLQAYAVPGGFVISVVYGSKTAWLQNVLAAGAATLEYQGQEVPVTNPRMIPTEEALALNSDVEAPPAMLKIGEFLRLDQTK